LPVERLVCLEAEESFQNLDHIVDDDRRVVGNPGQEVKRREDVDEVHCVEPFPHTKLPAAISKRPEKITVSSTKQGK
jgi:hypothetical protein